MYRFKTTIGAGCAIVDVEYDESLVYTESSIVHVLYQGKIVNDTLTEDTWGDLEIQCQQDYEKVKADLRDDFAICSHIDRTESMECSL